MNNENSTTVYGLDGFKVGTIVQIGATYEAYNLADIEVYSGNDYLLACWTLQGRA